jgi:hypothetical protein
MDTKVAAFYNTPARKPSLLWPALHADARAGRSMIRSLIAGVLTPDGRPLTPLRAQDIIIWEHEVTGCPK